MKRIFIDEIATNYEIDIFGNVYSLKRKKYLKAMTNKFGYKFVRIRLGHTNLYKIKFIHNLVGDAFLGQNSEMDINHKDGNKSNNILENLEYVTRSENLKHAYSKGLRKMKLNYDSILNIRNSKETGVSLSKKYGVSTAMISLIRNKKSRIYGY